MTGEWATRTASYLDRVRQRLLNECAHLRRMEERWGWDTYGVVGQLVEDAARPLPDALPPQPAWVPFQWSVGGEVDLREYWRRVERER